MDVLNEIKIEKLRLSPAIALYILPKAIVAVAIACTTLGVPAPVRSETLEEFTPVLNKGELDEIAAVMAVSSEPVPVLPAADNLSHKVVVKGDKRETLAPVELPAEPAAIASEPSIAINELDGPEAAIAAQKQKTETVEVEVEGDRTLEIPAGVTSNSLTPLSQNSIPGSPQPNSEQSDEPEPQVLVAELNIDGTDNPLLLDAIYRAISTQPGRPTTRTLLQEDVNEIFATGYFANVTVVPEDTPLGVRITFVVEPNPTISRVEIQTVPEREGDPIFSQEDIDEIFEEEYGQILNLRTFQARILELNEKYQEQGYDLAQVVGAPEVSEDGTVTLVVAEGQIEDIQVRFFDGEEQPTDGNTRPFIVTREIELKPGDVFNRQTAQRDLERVFGLGIFDDVRFSFAPGEDPSKVVINVDVVEASTGSIAAGAGISSASGLFGTVSYQQQNLGGNNQTIGAELQLGFREFLFDVSFTDPWIATHPNRLSYTVNAFRRRSISLIFDEGDPEINLPNGDRPRVVRTGGGIVFAQPLSDNPFEKAEWTASAGFEFQGISIEDSDGNRNARDSLGNLLSFSDSGKDNLMLLKFGATQDLRDNPFQPTSGSLLRLAMDQSVPVGSGNIFMNRLRASYSYYVPVALTNFTEGPQTIAINLQGGTVLGDLPPYEAFALGGSNSVRGYAEGDVGSGRSFLQLSAEYRFPLVTIAQFGVGGVLFVDYGTDLGTGDNVPGNPAGVRNKPGSGLGYGLGLRVQSPLGPIRVDYGINDQGDGRFHFGIGQRF